MGRKRTGMRRKNFPGRKRQRRIAALERLRKYDKARPTDADGHAKRQEQILNDRRMWQIVRLNKLLEDDDER